MARAQDMSFDLDEVHPDETGGPTSDMDFSDGDLSGGDTSDGGSGGSLDFIADLTATTEDDAASMAQEEAPVAVPERIYAVQQVYALRLNRFELAPNLGFSINDPYVSHPSVGFSANYWFTNVLAAGVSFQWYQGLESESDLNYFVRRSTRLAIPINEYQLGAHFNFTYVPIYGKFAMFNRYIFQWDAYVVGGVGTLRTRPTPVIDPEARTFSFDWRVAFNAGIGIRVFLTRWMAVYAELRDYPYLERFENVGVALGEQRFDNSTWYQDSPSLENNVSAYLGFSFFLPQTFEYRLPK